jgi:hypothetical protein
MENNNSDKDNSIPDIFKDAKILWTSEDGKTAFEDNYLQSALNIRPIRNRTLGERIEESIRILLDIFGFPILNDLSSDVKELGQYSFRKFSGHPLGIAWNRLMNAKQQLLLGHNLEISKELCVCFALADYLDAIQMSDNLERLVSDLSNKKDHDKFYKAFFEAHIASGSRSLGYRVSFVREGPQKTPDLELSNQEYTIVAECKSLDPQRIEMDMAWRETLEKSISYIDSVEKSYEIHITPAIYFMSTDSKSTLRFVKGLIGKDAEGLFYDPEGLVRIMMKKLADDYHTYITNLEVKFDDEENSLIQVKTEYIEKGFYAPIYLGILEKHSKPILPAIENNFRKARKKFKNYENYICIIYLEISSRSAKELSQKMDMCDFFIRHKLKNNQSISAVVISAYLYRGDSEWPFQQYSSIILNSSAMNPLQDVFVYGMEPLLKDTINTAQYSLLLVYNSKGWLNHLDKLHHLFSAYDNDLATQSRISLVDNSYFKFEYENNEIGKLVCRNLCSFPMSEEKVAVLATVDCEKRNADLWLNKKLSEIRYASEDYYAGSLKSAEKTSLFLNETHMIIEDINYLGFQYSPFLISTDYCYDKYYSDIGKVKQELADALNSILGLKKRAEKLNEDAIAKDHKSLVNNLVDRTLELLQKNLLLAEELGELPNIQDYENPRFKIDCQSLGANISILINKAVLDECYYRSKLGPLFS